MIVTFLQKWNCIRYQRSHGVHSSVLNCRFSNGLAEHPSGSFWWSRQRLLEPSQECLGDWFWWWNYSCLGLL